MKIKLETVNDTSILNITETLNIADLTVLRAGVNKMLKSGTRSILIDLSTLSEASLGSTDVLNLLSELKTWAREQTPLFALIGTLADFMDYRERAEAMSAFSSDLPRLMSLETKLIAQINALTERRKKLDEDLQVLEPVESKLKKLRKENTELKRKQEIIQLLTRRSAFKRSANYTASEVIQSKLASIQEVLFPVLEKEGFQSRSHE